MARLPARYTERKSFTVPVELKRQIKQRAAEQGISLSEYVRRATDALLDEREAAARDQREAARA